MSRLASLSPPLVLVFGHADPTGAAGLQGDLLTLASLGCHAVSVLTGFEVRDTRGCEEKEALDADVIVAQARALLEDMRVDAIKVSLPDRVENVVALAEVTSDYPEVPLVLDPSECVACRDESARDDALAAAFELLLPQARVLVAGRHELQALAGLEREGGDVDECVARCLEAGAAHVLYTGTAEAGPQVVSTLFSEAGVIRADTAERLAIRARGMGCTLSAALTAALAGGCEVAEAARLAHDFTHGALLAAIKPGMGLAMPDRFFARRSQA